MSTANRTGRFSTPTGNLEITGSLSSGVLFPGVSEVVPNLDTKAHAPGTPLKVIYSATGWGVREIRKDETADTVARARSACAILLGDTPFGSVPRYKRGLFGELVLEEVELEEEVEVKSATFDKNGDEISPAVFEMKKTRQMQPAETEEFSAARKRDGEEVPRSSRPDQWTIVESLGQAHMIVPEDTSPGDLVHGLRVLQVTSPGVGVVWVNLQLN